MELDWINFVGKTLIFEILETDKISYFPSQKIATTIKSVNSCYSIIRLILEPFEVCSDNTEGAINQATVTSSKNPEISFLVKVKREYKLKPEFVFLTGKVISISSNKSKDIYC